MILAIDGPAASGKSTVARRLAAALGATFLDTGAMYRAVTLQALEQGIDPSDGERLGELAESLQLTFDREGRIRIDGRPGEPAIRSARVTGAVSLVAAHPRVRRAVVALQRALGRGADLVAEGRDTTTVVFPEADYKFYLVASPAERARRRALEEGEPERVEEYERELTRRDHLDSTRKDSPLREAPDAVRIDTDGLSVDQVVERILEEVRA